jgi:hypothetical protein
MAKNLKCYISLPISGYDLAERRRLAEKVKSFLIAAGLEPISPLDKGLPDEAPYTEHLREDLRILLDCGSICLVKGWERSKGCNVENIIAQTLNLQTLYYSFDL